MDCRFDRAWVGPCREPAGDDGFCPKHRYVMCCSCGKQATRECDHTGIQFVCGYPLCDDCEHGTRPGIWGQARRGTRSALLLETAAKLADAGQVITVRSLADALQADPKRIWAAVSVLVQRGEWPHARPGERRA